MKFKRFCPYVVSGVVALSSVVMFYDPVPVFADAGNFAGYMDTVAGDAVSAYSALGGSTDALTFAGYALLFQMLANAADFSGIEEGAQLPAQNIAFVGKYQYQGYEKPGVLFCYPDHYVTSTGFAAPMFNSPDLQVTFGFTYDSPVTISAWNSGNTNGVCAWSVYGLSPQVQAYSSTGWSQTTPTFGLRYSISGSAAWGSTLPGDSYMYWLYNTNAEYIIGSALYISIPGNDFSPADLSSVWNSEVLPVLEALPDVSPYVPVPYVPDSTESPEYDDDLVTGIPREWTIKNPTLPTSPRVDWDLQDADFSKPMEYIENITDQAESVGFWWWLTEKTLKRLDLFNYFLAFLGFGIAAYCFWRWGS